MTDPTRLLDDPNLPDGMRELLQAGDPAPSVPKAEQRRMRSFVVSLAGTLGATWLLSAKIAVAALTLGAAGAGTWAAATSLGDSDEGSRQTSPVKAESAREAPDEQTPPMPVEISTDTAELDVEARSPRRPDISESDPVDALAAEVALLERARAMLASNPAGALRQTTRSRRLYRNGQLSEERELIAVAALVRLGRHAQAVRRARALIARNPDGMYARRARRLIESE